MEIEEIGKLDFNENGQIIIKIAETIEGEFVNNNKHYDKLIIINKMISLGLVYSKEVISIANLGGATTYTLTRRGDLFRTYSVYNEKSK